MATNIQFLNIVHQNQNQNQNQNFAFPIFPIFGNNLFPFFPTIPPESNAVVVCAVCGGICKPTTASPLANFESHDRDWMHPMLIKAKPKYQDWRKQPFTARAFNRIDDELFIEMGVSRFIGGAGGFYVSNPAKNSGVSNVSINTSLSEMAIPVHRNCLDLAKIFCRYQARFDIDFRSAGGGAPSSLAHLYEIWCKRAIAICPNGVMTKPFKEPTNYMGAPWAKLLDDYVKILENDKSLCKYEANPMYPGDITTRVICKYLQPLDTNDLEPSPEIAECWKRIENMPLEIGVRIIEAIEPFEDGLTKACLKPTRVLHNDWWREKLMSGTLIPWLFDLDNTLVDQHSLKYGHEDWDWERLCRQLAQPDVFEEGGILYGVSDHLWNRHRIWKVLNAARLGHMVFELPDEI
ncbi:hypothetical protein F4810DRAFT_716604 [Camillea tinctor]|nr:hypothetical protein F4810DRAFT_716604 [Camillea tinctor]